MPNDFAARVAISRFQRSETNTRSPPGRCPGLLHFAPLALGTQVVTQALLLPVLYRMCLGQPSGRAPRCMIELYLTVGLVPHRDPTGSITHLSHYLN